MKKNKFRSYFPIFKKNPNLVYFDTAAISLKPQSVTQSLSNFYNYNGLSDKTSGFLAEETNFLINQTRKKVAQFINSSFEEIIFTKGTTESLNILAQILEKNIQANDEIITSQLEHNSSILPWMKIANQKKAKLVYIPLDQNHKITVPNFQKVFSAKTKIIALTHMSNVLGYETPIAENNIYIK